MIQPWRLQPGRCPFPGHVAAHPGDLIRNRVGAGLSQQRLAVLAGIRQETISRLESGKHLASVKTIEKIERAIEAERRRMKRRRAK